MRAHLIPPLTLVLAACTAAGVSTPSPVAGPVASAATADREQAADQQVLHALSRLTFGARAGDAQRVRAMGVDRWIDEQLHPERIPDPAGERVVAAFPALKESAAELYAEAPPPGPLQRQIAQRVGELSARDSMEVRQAGQRAQRLVGQIAASRIARAVVSERQLDEVMVDFWLNHFNVYVAKGPLQRYLLVGYERDVIRPHALGKFRDLLGAVAHSPAMLYYLDNWQSVADSNAPRLDLARDNPRRVTGIDAAVPRRRGGLNGRGRNRPGPSAQGVRRGDPEDSARMAMALAQGNARRRGLNENYARELLELHTLGVDGGYTQKDVIEVARALTGWTFQPPRAGGDVRFAFVPRLHDAGQKVVLGHRLAANRGEIDGEQVLDIVARHPATARFIATKLVRRFVSDTPPGALVDRAAATFTRTNGDIRETLRTIITSPEFFSRAAYRAKVKSPFEVVVSALRAMNAEPDTTPRTAQIIAYLGQQPFGHQAPNGWPETGDAWMNTGAILNRINFGLAMAAGRVPGVRPANRPDLAALREAPRAQQVDGVVSALLGGDASADTRAVLLTGTNPLMASRVAESAPDSVEIEPASMAATPPDQTAAMNPLPGQGDFRPRRQQTGFGARPIPPLTGLAQIVGLALGAPEFQRR